MFDSRLLGVPVLKQFLSYRRSVLNIDVVRSDYFLPQLFPDFLRQYFIFSFENKNKTSTVFWFFFPQRLIKPHAKQMIVNSSYYFITTCPID